MGEGGGELSRPITSQAILRVHPLPSVMAIGQFITHTRTKWRHQEVSSVWAVDTESKTTPGYTKKELCCLSIKMSCLSIKIMITSDRHFRPSVFE